MAPAVSLAIVVAFLVFTFVPILAVHPFRVTALRPYAGGLTALWCLAAIAAVANPFPSPLWVQVLLVLFCLPLLLLAVACLASAARPGSLGRLARRVRAARRGAAGDPGTDRAS